MVPIGSEDDVSPKGNEGEANVAAVVGNAFSDDQQRLFDEMAAAEAQLKAAQEKYNAIRARIEASPAFAVESAVETHASPSYAQASQGTSSVVPNAVSSPSSVPTSQGVPNEGTGAARPKLSPQQPYYSYPYQQPGGSYAYTQPSYNASVAASKDHVAAGLLAIFLGFLGIHKFYLGYNTSGFIMLAVSILGSLLTFCLAGAVIWVIAIVEGILYLTKSQTEFEQTYVFSKHEWF